MDFLNSRGDVKHPILMIEDQITLYTIREEQLEHLILNFKRSIENIVKDRNEAIKIKPEMIENMEADGDSIQEYH
ncbi:hypothetical protein V1503_24640 [Bacillus sp. SCS-151]|uniref:hypothetical protein n=1 Tax=Nanhaiella sioensis TaxID=3115293 RepID=UPI00397B1781